MTKIFDGLYAEAYLAAIGLTLAKRNGDCSEFPDKEPTRAKTLWTSITAAWSDFWVARGESEFGFPSDY
jgi:hypothetical protein